MSSGPVILYHNFFLLFFQGIHCMGHRVELCWKDSATQITIYKRLDELLIGMYNFYHNSPLNRANLKQTAEALNAQFLAPTRVGGTRWLAHILKAIDHLIRSYPVLVEHMGQVNSIFFSFFRPCLVNF